MRLLILPRYSRLGASSRLRTLQYIPNLSAAGFDVSVAPFFDDAYLANLYAGNRPRAKTLRYFFARLKQLICGIKPDMIWLEKEAFPWLPWMLEKITLPHNVPIVSDYDDAIFHQYDLHRSSYVTGLLGSKIDSVMQNSHLVMAGNHYLAERARSAVAPRIEIIPTVVDIDAYSNLRHPSIDGRIRLGWIGSPSTWDEYCAPMLPIFTAAASKYNAVTRAVGASNGLISDKTLEVFSWSEETEIELIQGMDIGVMPLKDSPWARGKCGYKLIQYMACGLPVVASPIGVNCDIVEHGVNGFLAETDHDWHGAIQKLMSDSDLRQRMGAAGRKKIEEQYSLQVWGPRVARMFSAIIDDRASG